MHNGAVFADFQVPAGISPPERLVRRDGVSWRSAVWTPTTLGATAAGLVRGGFPELDTGRLTAAWSEAVAELRDARSAVRRLLDEPLARLTRLSPRGLAAGLDAILGGVSGEPAAEVFRRAEGLAGDGRRELVVIIAASNLPALSVQTLLPALALRRPVLIKSASAEPVFAPLFLEALCRREPRLRAAVAAVTWSGGDRELEAPLFTRAGKVVAYGGGEAIADLRVRAGTKLLPYGPKLSLAIVGADTDPASIADGLATDVALFDQRGCLSVQAIYTAGDGVALARALAKALAAKAKQWPMGPIDPHLAAGVRQLHGEGAMRRLFQPMLDLRQGTVLVEKDPALKPSPGLRTVRIHPVADLGEVPALLEPWSRRLQGAALAGADAEALEPALRELGFSRFAPPGELQSADAGWHNGGISPLEALA